MADAPIPKNNYPGNSQTGKNAKPPRKPLERVTSTEPIQRKTPLGKKLKATFGGDDARSVGLYVFYDVVLPATKNLLFDIITQGSERSIFGDVRNRTRGTIGRPVGYNKMYNGGSNNRDPRDNQLEPRHMTQRGRSTHNFDEIILASRGEAEEVLDQLSATIEQYDTATVSDLYALVGITGNFTDDKYGWTSLAESSVSSVRGGFLLNLPNPKALD